MGAATASEVMRTFGDSTTVVIKRRINPVLDPVAGAITEDSISLIPCLAVIGRVPDSAIDGKRIFTGDKQITISAETPVLKDDTLEISGEPYQTIAIDAPVVNGETLYYKVICRG